MPVDRVSFGQVVVSNAGRDKGHTYVVIGCEKSVKLLLADGRGRKAANPKKKNIRHISVLKSTNNGVAAKFARGEKVTDEDIRLTINTFTYTGN